MKKFVRNGKLAIILSGDYGAAWSTWGWEDERDQRLYDPELVSLILLKKEIRDNNKDDTYWEKKDWCEVNDKIANHCRTTYNLSKTQFTRREAEDLHVEWIPIGEKFLINEYDGLEVLVRDTDMITATGESENDDS